MPQSRRDLLALVAMAGLAPAIAHAEDPRMTERSLGQPNAKTTVIEYFSLTCTHCARFSREVMPEVREKLIDTGKVRIVYRDFPLDQVALTAAMIARALPPERYEQFISALFASQDRWAFAHEVNSTDELWKMAALAGMSRSTFDATIADDVLKRAILAEQKQGEDKYRVDSTPTFIINGDSHPGEMTFETFSQLVGAASG